MTPARAFAFWVGAVRELFEEAGVLLGGHALPAKALEDARARLNEGGLRWDAFVQDSDIKLLCDQLHYFSFWITPDAIPKRYSTRFFLAEMPVSQRASHCGRELTDSCWLTANAVLAASESGDMHVHYPTRKTLERLAPFESVSALSAWAISCSESGVPCNYPAFVPSSER